MKDGKSIEKGIQNENYIQHYIILHNSHRNRLLHE